MANPTGYEISEDLEEGTESGLDLFTSAGIPQEKKGFFFNNAQHKISFTCHQSNSKDCTKN